MIAQYESSPAQNLAYAKEYARRRYPNDKRLYEVFVAGAAFSEGRHFYSDQRLLAGDSEDPENEHIIFRKTKRDKTIAINTKTHQIFGIGPGKGNAPKNAGNGEGPSAGPRSNEKKTESGNVSSKGDSPLDLGALKDAVASVNYRITKKEIDDEHKRIVEARQFWGPKMEGPKGMDAINLLLKEMSGYVPAAWTRDDVGVIDLCWGDSAAGLKHIIIRRKQEGQNLPNVLRAIDEIMQSGKRDASLERDGAIVLVGGGHLVILSRPKRGGTRYVVSAYEEYKDKRSPRNRGRRKAFHR